MDAGVLGNIIIRAQTIESLLEQHWGASGRGFHERVSSVQHILPAILVRALRVVATVRNSAAHPTNFSDETLPSDFMQLCNELELLIPIFANYYRKKQNQPPSAKPEAENHTTVEESTNNRGPMPSDGFDITPLPTVRSIAQTLGIKPFLVIGALMERNTYKSINGALNDDELAFLYGRFGHPQPASELDTPMQKPETPNPYVRGQDGS
jgi:hypothetical protein